MYADDVGAVIAAIDDHAAARRRHLGARGPDGVTADELVAVLRDDDERRPTPTARPPRQRYRRFSATRSTP